jgi:hypothetical protein
MKFAIYLPALACVLIAVAAPRLAGRRQSPAAATWTLTLAASLAGLAYIWSLALLAGTLVDDLLPGLPGRQGVRLLADRSPVNDLVAGAATGALVLGLVRLVRTRLADRATYRQLAEACAGSHEGLVVLADRVPRAFAAPVGSGHVVVSSGMLAALSAAERRVLITHERTHLHRRHHWHAGVVRAAAAVCPLLVPLPAASTYLCERWADEVAAGEVGDRRLAATALARAALAASTAPGADLALGFHRAGVADRVSALQRPPARRRPVLAVAPLLVVAVAVAADIDATGDFVRLAGNVLGR